MTEAVVVHASAIVEALLATDVGLAVRDRIRGCALHAPAHLDAEVLATLEHLNESGALSDEHTAALVDALAAAPIQRHELSALLTAAWSARSRRQPTDGLYAELAAALGDLPLLITDARLAEDIELAELVVAVHIPNLDELRAEAAAGTG
jgi:predicted nucleic acid-binding protein